MKCSEGSGCQRTYGCDADPAGQEEAWVCETTSKSEDGGGDVGIDCVDGEKAYDCCLRGVIDEPGKKRGAGELAYPQPRLVLSSRRAVRQATYHLDMRQSVKKKDRYPEAKHY